jgi:hypothetical protein
VILVNGSGGPVTIGDNLQDSLRAAVSGQVPSGNGGGGGTGTDQQRIARLLAEAQMHFANAEAALKAGNLALYQSEIDAAQAAVEQAAKLAAQQGSGPGTPTGSPTPSVTPTASPSASPSP